MKGKCEFESCCFCFEYVKNRSKNAPTKSWIRYENLGSYYKTEFDLYLDHKIHTVYVEISVSISPTGNYFLK
jgi:hypothetical protein